MDENVVEQEKKLSDRERVALGGYLLLNGVVPNADILAYKASRTIESTANDNLLQRRASEWLGSEPCRAFILLWRDKAVKEGAIIAEEKSETENMLEELDNLFAETSDVDDKIKIIKVKADIRHKNKTELQSDNTAVHFYLPQRCNAKECPLYSQAYNRMKLQKNGK